MDGFFEYLAPFVLCKGNHQNQALNLVDTWRKRVRDFRAARATEQTSRSIAFLQEQSNSELVRTIEHAIEQAIQNPRRVQSQNDGPNSPVSHNRGRGGSPSEGRTAATTRPPLSTTSGRSGRRTEAAAPSPAVSEARRPVTPSGGAELRSNLRPDTAEGSMPAVTRLVHAARPSVNRRCVEGDCGICILPLREPESSTHDSEASHEDSHEGSHDDNAEEEGVLDDGQRPGRSSQFSEGSNELVWCQRQCGSNFHKNCMDQWVTACEQNSLSATCPNCRSVWRS
jgi:hypothetical protein